MQSSTLYRKAEAAGREEAVSGAMYNLILGGMLVWGFAINFLMVKYLPVQVLAVNPIVFLVAFLALCFGGIWIVNRTESAAVAFIGYTMIVAPIGISVYANVAASARETVILAFQYTSLISIGMMALGTIFPVFFRRISGALFIALLFAFAVMVLSIFFPSLEAGGWLDKLILVIFCGYIGYDWGVANSLPQTPLNAIRGAAMLYIDIINLFITILRLLSRRD